MRVYNLTNKEFLFRKQSIPPAGGYRDYPELDKGIPEIDRPLIESRMLSFGSLPGWWQKKADRPAATVLVEYLPPDTAAPSSSHDDIPEISDPSVVTEVPVESRLSKKELRNMRRGKR